jgi:hypothetical protein
MIAQAVPFQRSDSVNGVPPLDVYVPTATHAFVELHASPHSRLV